MKIDISKFKKLHTKKDHTILQHPDGHEIKVLHAHLSPENKQALDELPSPQKMAEGGEAIKKENYADGGLANSVKRFVNVASGNEEPVSAQAPVQSQDEKNEAIRQQAHKDFMGYADGGPVLNQQGVQSLASAFGNNKKAQGGLAKPSPGQYHFHFYADGGSAQSSSPEQSPADAFQQSVGQDQAPQVAQPIPDEQAQPVSATPEAPIAPVDPNAAPQGTLPEQELANTENENKAGLEAAKNTQQVQGQEADIFGKQAKQEQDLRTKYEKIGDDLHTKFNEVSDQVAKSQIDPNHWWTSKSTGGQIATAIGMLFAGAGAGISGHPEMASAAIDKAVSMDIDAQKHNLENKHTLLSKYMDMYHSLPQAEAAARLTMEAGIEGQIKQQAAKLGSQNALLTEQQLIAQRRKAALPHLEGLAKGQVMGQMYQGMNAPQQAGNEEQAYQQRMANMRILKPDLGKDMQEKYLPNIGVSKVPIPDALREKLIAGKDLSDKLAKLENFARENQGTVLNREIVNQGKTLAADAQQAARIAGHQGVYKESDQKFLEGMIDPDPTKFLANTRTIPKYNQLRKSNDSTMQQYFKGYGIKPFDNQSNVQSVSGSVQTATNSKGEKLALKDGKWVPVK